MIKDYQRLLSYEEQMKYKQAIKQHYFDDYHSVAWRHTFWGAYIWKYPRRTKVLKRLEEIVGHRPDWTDITDDVLRDLREELIANVSPNSAKTELAELKAILNAHKEDKNIPSKSFDKILSSKAELSQAVFLDSLELRHFKDLITHTPRERYVQRLFMIECLTGARYVDAKNITTDNCDYITGMLTYIAQKTKTEITVPVHRWLMPFLTKDRDEPTDLTPASYNTILRDLCKKCGIDSNVKIYKAGENSSGPKYNFVSSHTGRRTFATLLARKGVPLEQISLLMGHMKGNMPNINTTQRYIVGKLRIDQSVKLIFQGKS
jgi:integrase